MVSAEQEELTPKLRKQIEYYLSDANLVRDNFFRDQISTDKEGWVSIGHFLNCNKVKALKVSQEQIAEACTDSSEVDVHSDKTKIRRKDNKAMPEKELKRRDAKVADKEKSAMAKQGGAAAQQEDEFDADGKIILVEKDFDNP